MLRASLLALCVLSACRSTPASDDAGPRLVHSVYFTLRDDTPEARAALVDACTRLLAPIDGIVHFDAGERDAELAREVNDLDFDVALLVVFRDRAAHDRYQPDARHQRFIGENSGNWERVRVFDSRSGAAPDAP